MGKEAAKSLKFALPGGVVLSSIAVIFLVFIIALIGYFPDTRLSLYAGAVWVVLLMLGYPLTRRKR